MLLLYFVGDYVFKKIFDYKRNHPGPGPSSCAPSAVLQRQKCMY